MLSRVEAAGAWDNNVHPNDGAYSISFRLFFEVFPADNLENPSLAVSQKSLFLL
jgi:hypothetical protein